MKKLATALLCVLLGVTCTSAFSACKDNGPTSDSSGGKPPVVVDSNPTVVGGGDTFYFFAETGKDLEFTMSMKGGSFQSLKRGDALLTRDTDYTWSTSREILAIKHSYLSSLAEGEYSFTFTTSLGSCELAVSVGRATSRRDIRCNLPIPPWIRPLWRRWITSSPRSPGTTRR